MQKEFSNFPQLYVVIAGQGGAGKEGIAKVTADYLSEKTGRKSIITREPSDEFRKKVFTANKKRASGLVLSEMFYQDGAKVEKTIVQQTLNNGKNVVSVRGRESTWAYQIPKGISEAEILQMHRRYLGDFGPDVVIHLCLSDPRIGLERKGKKLDGDTFDKEDLPYHWAVKKEYDKLATRFAVTSSSIFPTPIFGNWITIDADRPIKEVRGQVKDLLREYLLLRKK